MFWCCPVLSHPHGDSSSFTLLRSQSSSPLTTSAIIPLYLLSKASFVDPSLLGILANQDHVGTDRHTEPAPGLAQCIFMVLSPASFSSTDPEGAPPQPPSPSCVPAHLSMLHKVFCGAFCRKQGHPVEGRKKDMVGGGKHFLDSPVPFPEVDQVSAGLV